MLVETIQSIAAQTFDLSELEVLVVTQSHTLTAEQLIEAEELVVKVIHKKDGGTISESRNIGVRQATGDYLAFLDADIYLSSNWVEKMLTLLQQDTNRVIVSAMQTCAADAPPLEKLRTSLSNAEIDTEVAFLPGRNLFMQRKSFEQIGGFPEHLITCEDYYFTDKATALGTLYYSSGVSYIHLGEDKVFSEMFEKEKWRGQSNLQSISGRKVPLREIPSFVLPVGICISILLALISVFLGWQMLAAVFVVLAFLPVLVYSVRAHKLGRGQFSLATALKFYTYYFPARAYGTLVGLFKSIGADHS